MKQQIEQEIKKAITRHLVQHVQVPKEDTRDRIDILVDEAATAILSRMGSPMEGIFEELMSTFPMVLPDHSHVPFYSVDDIVRMTKLPTCTKCEMPVHPVFGAICAAEDCPGHKK